MLTITELITSSFKNVTYTEKLFFNQYMYKIVLQPVDTTVVNYESYSYLNRWRIINRAKSRESAVDLFRQVKNMLPDIDYRNRVEGRKLTFYTNSEKNIESLIENFRDSIIEVSCPYNDNHKDLITTDRKIRVRKNLFNEEFKFKVTFNPTWEMRENRLPEIREWIETLGNGGKRWSPNFVLNRFLFSKKSHRELGWTVAVYLNDEADLFICRLKFHSMIKQVEEAVLIKDL